MQLDSVFTVESSLGSNTKEGIQAMPLDESSNVSHFWVHTVRKHFPVLCVDGMDRTWLVRSRRWNGDNLLEDQFVVVLNHQTCSWGGYVNQSISMTACERSNSSVDGGFSTTASKERKEHSFLLDHREITARMKIEHILFYIHVWFNKRLATDKIHLAV